MRARRVAVTWMAATASLAALCPAAAQQDDPSRNPPDLSGTAEERSPRLLSAEEAEREIAALYPPALLAREVPGDVAVTFRILVDGSVDSASITVDLATDSAFVEPALAVVRRLRYTPRQMRGTPVTAWQQLRVRFAPPRNAPPLGDVLWPAAQRPRLLNHDAIQRQMAERYPEALLPGKVPGAVLLRVRVLADGSVDSASVAAIQATDTAFVGPSVAIGRQLRFSPAMRAPRVLGGFFSEYWYTFDIRFLPTRRIGWPEDRLPRFLNGDEIDRLVADVYPRELRASGVEGAVSLRFRVQEDGTVDSASVLPLGATHEGFTEAGAAVTRRLRFAPATANGEPVAYWHSFHILFSIPVRSAPPDEFTYELSAVEELPVLRNGDDVQRQVTALYPPALRDSAIAGDVLLRFRLLENGRVEPASVRVENASHPALAEPATAVAQRMRFAPAKVNGRPVKAWIVIPIYFHPDTDAPR